MEEIWKDINGYEGLYQASNKGIIRSLDRWVKDNEGRRFVKGRILKPLLNKDGYQKVGICKNGKTKRCSVHRLVYEAFFGKIPEGMQVNHKDENKENNILSNIDTLMTCKENNNWGTRNERMAKSLTNHPKKSKPVIQKTLQGEIIDVWASTREIERQLGYDQGHISDCCNGKRKTAYKYIWEYTDEKATA